jgi:hypothetical protein
MNELNKRGGKFTRRKAPKIGFGMPRCGGWAGEPIRHQIRPKAGQIRNKIKIDQESRLIRTDAQMRYFLSLIV